MPDVPTTKGTVPFGSHRTWYRITGEPGSGKPAIVLLHGGPGSTHDYLLSMAALAEDGWPVVHYDQLGNGGSTHLPDAPSDFWTVQLFADELDNLLTELGIADNYVLFGQSWGGLLATVHAAKRPKGLKGVVIANSPASMPVWREEMKRLRADLPPGVDETLARHEAAGTTETGEYLNAMRVFYDKHVCRVTPWPRDVAATFMEIYNDSTVYETMNGPSEFHVTGSLKDFDVVDLLPDIEVPCLVISGAHDEATPETVRPYAESIAQARWVVFEESSHMPHVEEPDRFRAVMNEYLSELDSSVGAT